MPNFTLQNSKRLDCSLIFSKELISEDFIHTDHLFDLVLYTVVGYDVNNIKFCLTDQ